MSRTRKYPQFGPKDLLEHIDSFGKRLNKWEIEFVANQIDSGETKFSKDQVAVIERIYEQKC